MESACAHHALLFGGVSELEGEALTPGVDFRVAVVGPLTSLAIALVAGGGCCC